jgi:hypothetical protein
MVYLHSKNFEMCNLETETVSQYFATLSVIVSMRPFLDRHNILEQQCHNYTWHCIQRRGHCPFSPLPKDQVWLIPWSFICYFICGIFCFTTVVTLKFLLGRKQERHSLKVTEGLCIQMLSWIVSVVIAKLVQVDWEREFNFSGSGGVKLTAGAMRFIDWDDTHIHTHGIISLIKQATWS